MGILRVLQQVTLPSFGMMCSISQLTSAHPFLSLFIFFCHRHHMECFLFSDLRIFSLSLPLCAWCSSTPFLLFVFYLFFCWIYAVVLVWCLGIRFHKRLIDFICHHILYQLLRSINSRPSGENVNFAFCLLRSCLPGLGALTLCTSWPSIRLCPMAAAL